MKQNGNKVKRRDLLKTIVASSVVSYGYLYGSHVFAGERSSQWSTGAGLEYPIQEIYPSVFNGEIYVSGGFVPSKAPVFFGLAPSDDVQVYSPKTGSWRQGRKLPEARHHLGMASNSRYLYGIGGFRGDKSNAWQIQDTVFRMDSDAWQKGPSLPIPMAESVYASNGESIHVIGGKTRDLASTRNKDTSEHFILIDDRHWEKAAPIGVARNSAACAVLNGKIYVVGGRVAGKGAKNLNALEVYDTKLDKWESRRPLPISTAGLAAASFNGKILVAGGEAFGPNGNWKTGKAFSDVWSYDPSTDLWGKERNMPHPRHGHGAVSLDDQVYIVGGAAKVGPQETLSSLIFLGS